VAGLVRRVVVGVDDPVGPDVAEAVGTSVAPGPGLAEAAGPGGALGPGVAVAAGVALAVGLGVAVAAGVALAVGLGVAVALGVGAVVGLGVAVALGVATGVGVGVACGFGFDVAPGPLPPALSVGAAAYAIPGTAPDSCASPIPRRQAMIASGIRIPRASVPLRTVDSSMVLGIPVRPATGGSAGRRPPYRSRRRGARCPPEVPESARTMGVWARCAHAPTIGCAMGAPTGDTQLRSRVADAADPAGEVAALVAQLRTGIISLATGAFLIAMTAITVLALTAHVPSPIAIAAIIALGGGLTGLVVSRLTARVLDRAHHLGRVSHDLTDLYDRARLDAIRDGLTGLGNHRAFQEELDRAGEMANRHGQSTALLLIDVDDLKRTNDTQGHEAGDEALQDVARVIVMNSRRTDRAFRVGGDEFALLSPGASAQDALTLGRRILATALDAAENSGHRPISLTIGISAVPDPSADRQQLYRHADAALYWGKRHGRTDVQVYDSSLHGIADDERPAEELAAAIDATVADRLLTAVYQPVFRLDDGRCTGFEGLVRPLPSAGFRNPSAMFIAAEAVNRTVELDLAAIRTIAAGAAKLEPDCHLAINLSPRTIEAVAFNPHEVLAVMAAAGIEPHRLVIELTEREAIEDMGRLARNLAVFRRTGARIAADDVGAGNAGLQLLSRIEFDVIKIDLSLVQTGAVLAPSRSVLRALIDLAQRRGATTVAEGIETPLHLEIVRELGITTGQGFLLGRPAPEPVADPVNMDALIARLEAIREMEAAARKAEGTAAA
jgi:diguanylate cyclase (GGDEF)-like protein